MPVPSASFVDSMMIAKVHGGDNPAPLGIPQAVGLVNSSSIQPAIQGQFNAASLQLLLPNEDLLKTHSPLLEPEFMTKPQVTSLCIHCDSATGRPHPGLPVGRCCDYRGYRDGCSSPGELTERKKEEEKGNGLSSPISPSFARRSHRWWYSLRSPGMPRSTMISRTYPSATGRHISSTRTTTKIETRCTLPPQNRPASTPLP